MDSKEEHIILLDLLCRVNNANEGLSFASISEGERLRDAHFLANKFISHALTVLYLINGTHVRDLPSFKSLSFPDSTSIDVLTRTTMEAFLVFHYVFFASATAEEKDFRYLVYKAAGLAERQNFPAATDEYKQMLAEEKVMLDKLRDKLNSNTVFQSLKDWQKRQIFEGRGKWRWEAGVEKHLSWRDIAIDARFSKMLASHMYRHLSGHAHSSSLSVLQWQQALMNKEIGQLIKSSIGAMKILIANMIQEYCSLFSKAQDVLSRDPEGNNIVEVWIQIGNGLDEFTNIGRGND